MVQLAMKCDTLKTLPEIARLASLALFIIQGLCVSFMENQKTNIKVMLLHKVNTHSNKHLALLHGQWHKSRMEPGGSLRSTELDMHISLWTIFPKQKNEKKDMG